jgi:hypothetical protein
MDVTPEEARYLHRESIRFLESCPTWDGLQLPQGWKTVEVLPGVFKVFTEEGKIAYTQKELENCRQLIDNRLFESIGKEFSESPESVEEIITPEQAEILAHLDNLGIDPDLDLHQTEGETE